MGKEKINIIIAFCFVIAFFASSSSVHAEEIVGKAKVIAGDLIEIDGRRVRLYGIDAPDLDQICLSKKGEEYKCGDHAKRHLAVMIGRLPLTCKGEKKDENGALIAVCSIRWLDINENIVFDGWALAYREHGDDYVRAELAAKARHQGLWRGSAFVTPWEWRAGARDFRKPR
ncbi:MAG TPA: thermonuclease family protein [Rhodospirillales bacterium]|nr:thermonuclease family protein [Rhodospirillales bacterium]